MTGKMSAGETAKSRWTSPKDLLALLLLGLALAIPIAFIVYEQVRARDFDANDVLDKCFEEQARRAAPGNKGIELQSNRARPTMAIALADKESAVDSITFSTKVLPQGRQTVPDNPRARTSAVLTEFPRQSAVAPFNGQVKTRATTAAGATVVRLRLCVVRGAPLKAGAFQGTARIYGPAVADFDYAVIITQKWPWYIAAAILWYAGLLFLIAAWQTGSLTFSRPDGDRTTPRAGSPPRGVSKIIATGTGIVIGFVAMVPTFFGTYWNNATWGSDPGTQISGLATAGLTAAFAGLAAAHKLLEKAPTETEGEVAAEKLAEQKAAAEKLDGPSGSAAT